MSLLNLWEGKKKKKKKWETKIPETKTRTTQNVFNAFI